MKSVEFCYWLQGHFELNPGQPLTAEQTRCIQAHLALVFKHEIDPSYPNGAALTAIHEAGKMALPHPHPLSVQPNDSVDPGKVLRC